MSTKIYKSKKKKLVIALLVIAIVFAICVGACAIYLGDYYRASSDAIATFTPMTEVDITTLENGDTVFHAESSVAGLIFYPGGKVESEAYQPLMAALATRGITCILVDMPFNLAVFDINAADGIREQYPEITDWYIGGHSLGGSMAASYVKKHADEFCGLVLLGSYSTADLSEGSPKVLSVYGSEDGIMNREKYEANKGNLPKDFTEKVIDGGNHSYFGMYGEQDGDGRASISCEEQIHITAAIIEDFIRQ